MRFLMLLLALTASVAAQLNAPITQPPKQTPLLADSAAGVINVKSAPFHAVGDGLADDAPAINQALAAARKTGPYGSGTKGAAVFIPPGIYRLDTPLDLNGGQFNLLGAGSYQTVLRGNTGDKTAVLEFVGSGFCKISGLLIDNLVDALPPAERRPSSIGVLLARVDAPQNSADYAGPRFAAQSWFNNLEDVTIRLGTHPAANGGHGTCAYYNFCSEVSNWHNCFFLADTAAVISTANLFGLQMKTVRDVEWRPGAPERMRIWAGESSMTVVRASGANSLFGITGPALVIGGGSDISIDSCIGHQAHLYLPNEPARWPRYAIDVRGVSHNLAYRGSIEGYPGALRIAGVQVSGLDLRAYLDIQPMLGPNGAEIDSVPVIMLDHRRVEHPPGSGSFTAVGSSLTNSQLASVTTPSTASVIGRLLDTSSDASHIVAGNHLTLGNMKVRLRNAWPANSFSGNIATSTLPLGSGQFNTPAGIARQGNLLATTTGLETDSSIPPAAVSALPEPSPTHRGHLLRLEGAPGAADGLFICEKDAAGKYVWRAL